MYKKKKKKKKKNNPPLIHFGCPTNKHISIFGSNLLDFLFITCAKRPPNANVSRTRLWPQLQLDRYLGNKFEGTKFNKYIAVSRAYPQKDISRVA